MLRTSRNCVFAFTAICFVVLGCSRLQPKQQPTPPQPAQRQDEEAPRAGNPRPFPGDQSPGNPNAGGDNSDPSVLYGSWTNESQIGGMPCRSEFIFERTGTYSALATCDNGYGGTYMTRSVGHWKLLQPGMVRIQYTDHEPKEFGGNPIRYPDGETMTFTVRDHDHLDTSGGLLNREF
jgi:hypothetical protein